MGYVIAEPRINVKDRACVEVCPPVCPVEAISLADEVPAQWKAYTEMNADYYEPSREAFMEKWGVEP